MLSSFASDILNAIEEHGITVSNLAQDFQHDPLAAFESFLNRIIDALGEHKLILFIDEFDVLEQVVKDNTEMSDRDAVFAQLIRPLIALMKRVEGVHFLLAGDTQRHRWSALKDDVIAYHLSELEPEGALQLITDPVKAPLLEYSPHALERMLRLTNNQPYLIQLLCKTVVDYCNKKEINYVDTHPHVADAVDVILDGDTNYLAWTWRYLLNKQEHLILSFVAQDQEGDDRAVSARYIGHQLEFERNELLDVLNRLQEKSMLKRVDTDGHPRFKIAADLMREWLRRTKPLELVKREWLRRTKPLN
jgi:hypothetical protein